MSTILDDTTLERKIEETHAMTTEILKNTQYLSNLAMISTTLSEIKVGLLSAAVGRDQVPLTVVQSLFKMWGTVIFALLLILVFLLTGRAFGWFNLIPS